MPNWRQNLLSAGESLSLPEGGKKQQNTFQHSTNGVQHSNNGIQHSNNGLQHSSNSLSRLVSNSISIVAMENFQKSNTGSRKSTKTMTETVSNSATNFQFGTDRQFPFTGGKSQFFCRESDLSADFSSFLTDSSSFADYEDRRGSVSNLEDPPIKKEAVTNNDLDDSDNTYVQSLFYPTLKFDKEAKDHDLYMEEQISDGSDLSSSSCDSFERCEFDCRDFEPFSDTCCCEPTSDGACARSPKLLDSADDHCTSPLHRDDDGLSARSDMDGLDLTLFEPANANAGHQKLDKQDGRCSTNFECDVGEDGNVVVGLLNILMEEHVDNSELTFLYSNLSVIMRGLLPN